MPTDRDPDPNLSYYRQAFMEMQAEVARMQRAMMAMRARACAAHEEVGVTTSDDGGVW